MVIRIGTVDSSSGPTYYVTIERESTRVASFALSLEELRELAVRLACASPEVAIEIDRTAR